MSTYSLRNLDDSVDGYYIFDIMCSREIIGQAQINTNGISVKYLHEDTVMISSYNKLHVSIATIRKHIHESIDEYLLTVELSEEQPKKMKKSKRSLLKRMLKPSYYVISVIGTILPMIF